ncbi:hypothetical protein IWX90DRAFT_16694 [Phyllosticta citrichinensis]|uniref:Uncharacterized protein n=1 Tax=Phyllosticta citrichinensis TaxID=1130410 RepID=A0ABR1Y6E9_9PEZI
MLALYKQSQPAVSCRSSSSLTSKKFNRGNGVGRQSTFSNASAHLCCHWHHLDRLSVVQRLFPFSGAIPGAQTGGGDAILESLGRMRAGKVIHSRAREAARSIRQGGACRAQRGKWTVRDDMGASWQCTQPLGQGSSLLPKLHPRRVLVRIHRLPHRKAAERHNRQVVFASSRVAVRGAPCRQDWRALRFPGNLSKTRKAFDLSFAYRCLNLDVIMYLCYGTTINALAEPEFRSPSLVAVDASVPIGLRFKHFPLYRTLILAVAPLLSKVVSNPEMAGMVHLHTLLHGQVS